MHVLYLAPEHPPPHRDFVAALKAVGARVSGIGHRPPSALDVELRGWLDGYAQVASLFAPPEVERAARELGRRVAVDRVEATDEMLVLPAARLRQALGAPGLAVDKALLTRDKTAMKEALRAGGIPCAESAACASRAEALAFAERVGYPVVVKPRAGLGSQNTFRADDAAALERALGALGVGADERSVAIEEFVDGHEGFYDTLTVRGEVRHEFVAHYYPNVLVAMADRSVAPQIVATNRIDRESYGELRRLGREVIRLLGIETSATHMEWFFGPKGLRFSEIGSRPPGERLWDLHCIGNEMDLYREWALAVVAGRSEQTPSRRYAAGSVQVRPDRDGRIAAYEGLDAVWKACAPWVVKASVPPPGTPTRPLRLGYLENTWFRLRHPDYDHLRGMLDFIGRTVRVRAEPA